jgi:hypothetical protein
MRITVLSRHPNTCITDDTNQSHVRVPIKTASEGIYRKTELSQSCLATYLVKQWGVGHAAQDYNFLY